MLLNKEVWKSIPGYDGLYEVSNLGRVKRYSKRFKEGYIFRYPPKTIYSGYYRIGLLDKNRKIKTWQYSTLVMITFKPYLGNEYVEVNHKDGNKLNNNIDNLEWVTPKQNVKHSYDIGIHKPLKGVSNGCAKLTDNNIRDIKRLYDGKKYTIYDLGRMFGCSGQNIWCILKGKKWSHIK